MSKIKTESTRRMKQKKTDKFGDKIKLNIDNITEGQVFKNYPELCRALGCNIYGGYQKVKQLNEFLRYFNYEKLDKKYIIKEVYTVARRKDHRVAVNAKYVPIIQNILLSYLNKQSSKDVYLTQKHLWIVLGLVNEHYLTMREDHRIESLKKLSDDIGIIDIKDFYKRSSMKFGDIIKLSLNSLARRNIIKYKEVYRIGTVVSGDDFYYSGIEYRDATDNEERYIKRIKKQLLEEFGHKTEFFIDGNKRNLFYDKLDRVLGERRGWAKVYSCYKITRCEDVPVMDIDEESERKRLNQLIIDVLNDQAEDNYQKKGITANNAAERSFDEEKPFFYYKGYQNRQRILTEALIRRK